jgi:hypothetical protein
MRRWIKLHILSSLVLFSACLSGQQADPYQIIDSARAVLESVYDYRADIEVEVEVDFINMPVKHATVYYKKPDKIKFKSDEFIMLPKRGLGDRVTQILDEPFTAIYLGEEYISEEPCHVVRIVPMGKNPKVILATWWIDRGAHRLARSTTNTKDQGSFTIDFKYENDTFPLPSEMIFSFEIEKFSLPLKFIGKTQGMEFDKRKMEEVNEGKVFIRFSNYSINSSMPDELFDEEEAVNIDL